MSATNIYEIHEREQYFFDQATLDHLSGFLCLFAKPCCLCAPLLGAEVEKRGIEVAILDVDERFANLQGFVRFDLNRPTWLGTRFDVILCDPPFFKVSLSQLFAALRTLSLYDFRQPLLLSYLTRRETKVLNTFSPFSLRSTGYYPQYQTVKKCERNEIQLYSNLPKEKLTQLKA